jgi:predicted nucleotidyltransferase
MTLKELRKKHKLSQEECAKYLEIPRRTYQDYETDLSKINTVKYKYMVEKMEKYGHIDETNGVLSLEKIKELCSEVFESRNVEYCYLFGSYAKGKATETSDVDLLIATSDSGLRFFDLVESLRESLCKKVDVLTLEQLNNNTQLLNEILKDGIRIYG